MSIHDDTPDWLRPARTAFNRLQPGADQEAAQLARLTEQQRVLRVHRSVAESAEAHEPRWLRRLAWGGGALGATAAVLLSAMLLLDPPGTRTARAEPATGTGFIPLVPEGEFRAALAASRSVAVWLQPAELPRERLALLGLPFDAARADETVRAELMLNPSGQLLAVRILEVGP